MTIDLTPITDIKQALNDNWSTITPWSLQVGGKGYKNSSLQCGSNWRDEATIAAGSSKDGDIYFSLENSNHERSSFTLTLESAEALASRLLVLAEYIRKLRDENEQQGN